MNLSEYTKIYPKACEFARKAHDGQVRKYTGDPYFNHCRDVSSIVSDSMINTYDHLHVQMDFSIIALLHDTVEDTDIEIVDIEKEFGEYIAHIVFWLTDVSIYHKGNRKFRKRLDREHLRRAPYEAKVIKCADLIDNSKSIIQYDSDFAKVYIGEKLLLLDAISDIKFHPLWKIANDIVKNYYNNE